MLNWTRIVALSLVGLWLPAVGLAAEPIGFVAAVKGEAGLERSGQRIEARIGLPVQAGDRLVTGPKARLKVLLSDDSVLALGSDSQVELTRHLFDRGAHARLTRIQLLAGSLRALVQKAVAGSQADFEVRTSTAVAGVRGTEFAVLAGPDGDRLVTFSGAVEWALPESPAVLVSAGQSCRVEAGRPGQLEALAAAELAEVRSATDAAQSPSALAWNLAPRDRLGRGPTSQAGSGFDQDPDSTPPVPGPVQEDDFRYGGAVPPEQDVGDLGGSGHDRYGGEAPPSDGASALFFGAWANSDERDPAELGLIHDFSLTLTLQRNP